MKPVRGVVLDHEHVEIDEDALRGLGASVDDRVIAEFGDGTVISARVVGPRLVRLEQDIGRSNSRTRRVRIRLPRSA